MSIYRRLLVVLLTGFSAPIVEAASKTEIADRVVNAVLEQEARGEVHERRGQLGDLVDQTDRARWAAGYIKTADGWQRFDTPQPTDDRLREYEQRRGTEPLTPEQHLQLANWCRDQNLAERERAHLWSSLRVQNYGVTAFRRLGYENKNGEWRTREEDLGIIDQQRKWNTAYRKWLPRAKSIHALLTQADVSKRVSGREQLMAVSDVEAIPALEATLGYSSAEEANEFIQYLSNNEGNYFTRALLRQAMLSPWESTRAMAGDQLRLRRVDTYVPLLLSTAMKPLELSVNRKLVCLGIKRDLQTVGVKLESVMLVQITAKSETRDTVPEFILQRVVPVVLYGRIGIEGKVPDFSADGVIDLSWKNKLQSSSLIKEGIEFGSDSIDHSMQSGVTRDIVQMNIHIRKWNERVSDTLTRSAGFPAKMSLEEIWQEWSQLTHTESVGQKPVISTTQVEVSERTLVGFDRLNPSCLPAATPITTNCGSRPVESIQIGDLVLAKDIDTGELSYKPVIRTTVRVPQPLVTLHTKGDSIRATLGHYFWVSGQGWRMAKEIKPGDRLHGVDGTITVTDVSRGGREAVYNLVVEGANTYFVGAGKILSHDVTPPVPTDIIVPGLAAR